MSWAEGPGDLENLSLVGSELTNSSITEIRGEGYAMSGTEVLGDFKTSGADEPGGRWS